jgi:hypothetical protein
LKHLNIRFPCKIFAQNLLYTIFFGTTIDIDPNFGWISQLENIFEILEHLLHEGPIDIEFLLMLRYSKNFKNYFLIDQDWKLANQTKIEANICCGSGKKWYKANFEQKSYTNTLC